MVKIVIEDPGNGDIDIKEAGGDLLITIFDRPDYYGMEICELVLQKDIVKAIRNHFYNKESKHV